MEQNDHSKIDKCCANIQFLCRILPTFGHSARYFTINYFPDEEFILLKGKYRFKQYVLLKIWCKIFIGCGMNMHFRFCYYLEKRSKVYIYTEGKWGRNAGTLARILWSWFPLLVNVLIMNSYHEEEFHGKFGSFLVNA